MVCRCLQMHQKQGGGAHLTECTARGTWSLLETKLHINYLELKAVFLGLKKRVPRPLHTQDNTYRDRQHHSGVIHKQGRRHEVGPTLCFTMENLDLVHQKSSNPQSPTHSRPAECGLRQAIQARPDHPKWSLLQEVIQAICNRWHRPQIDLFATWFSNKLPLCHRYRIPWPQQWMRSVCHGRIRKHTPSHYQPYWAKGDVAGLPMQEDHSDCSGVAQHALVLGSSGHVQPNPTEPAQSA